MGAIHSLVRTEGAEVGPKDICGAGLRKSLVCHAKDVIHKDVCHAGSK